MCLVPNCELNNVAELISNFYNGINIISYCSLIFGWVTV